LVGLGGRGGGGGGRRGAASRRLRQPRKLLRSTLAGWARRGAGPHREHRETRVSVYDSDSPRLMSRRAPGPAALQPRRRGRRGSLAGWARRGAALDRKKGHSFISNHQGREKKARAVRTGRRGCRHMTRRAPGGCLGEPAPGPAAPQPRRGGRCGPGDSGVLGIRSSPASGPQAAAGDRRRRQGGRRRPAPRLRCADPTRYSDRSRLGPGLG
jgi:hypothetical protein